MVKKIILYNIFDAYVFAIFKLILIHSTTDILVFIFKLNFIENIAIRFTTL